MTDYDPQTALIVVDLQNDFADPAGSLTVKGGQSIVPIVNDQVEAAGRAGSIIVYTQAGASGRSTAWPARGERSSIRNCS